MSRDTFATGYIQHEMKTLSMNGSEIGTGRVRTARREMETSNNSNIFL